jgi:hypothetical protein
MGEVKKCWVAGYFVRKLIDVFQKGKRTWEKERFGASGF